MQAILKNKKPLGLLQAVLFLIIIAAWICTTHVVFHRSKRLPTLCIVSPAQTTRLILRLLLRYAFVKVLYTSALIINTLFYHFCVYSATQWLYFLKNLTRHITRSFRHTRNAISSIFCHAVDKSELLGATLGFLPSSRTGAIYVWNDYQKRSPNIQILHSDFFHYLFL